MAFKQQERINYPQSEIVGLLGDFLFGLERQGIADYKHSALDLLQKWAQQGYLRRYYESGDEPIYELSPASENALKWLEDLNKQQFVGTHSRLLQFFSLLQLIVNRTAGPYERIQQLQAEKKKIDEEIDRIKKGNYTKPSETQLKEDYYLAEETARRLLSDFRQVEENFRDLDTKTRQAIIKTNLAKGALLDSIFEQQDYLRNTDQGKSFKAFWEFLMSESMQQQLEELIAKLNEIPAIQQIKQEQLIDRIKTNLVDAGDKVNRSNDGLIEQLRKFVEQKNLAESRHILKGIETIEQLLLEHKDSIEPQNTLMEIDGIFRPSFVMERPLYSPPAKVAFTETAVVAGMADANTDSLFAQFYIDIEELRRNVRDMLRTKSQIALSEVLTHYRPTKGIAEILGYMQIATWDNRHHINNDQTELLAVSNADAGKTYSVKAPLIIFNR